MFKKIICLINVLLLLLSAIPAIAAQEAKVFINETFSEYPENATTFNGIKIQTGVDKRVINDKGNKALYSKAWGEGAKIKKDFQAPENGDTFVYSAKIKIQGNKTSGKLFDFYDGINKITFVNMKDDGTLTLPDGKKLGGMIYGKWTEFTLIVSWKTHVVDVYIDNKCVASDWYFNKSVYLPMKELVWQINEPGEGATELFIDDIRGYTGKTLPHQMNFPVIDNVSEILPFTPLASLDFTPQLLFSSDFEAGFGGSTVLGGGKIERPQISEDNSVYHFHSDGSADVSGWIDFTCNDVQNMSKYSISVDVMVNKMTGDSSKIAIFDGKDSLINDWQYLPDIFPGPKFRASVSGKTFSDMETGKWYELTYCFNLGAGMANVYVDGVNVGEHAVSDSKAPTIFRINGTSKIGYIVDFYADNVRIYSGNSYLPKDYFENSGEETSKNQTVNYSIYDVWAGSASYLKNCEVYMYSCDYMFAKDEKFLYPSPKPYVDAGNTFMMPLSLANQVYGLSHTFDEGTGEVSINGNSFTKIGSTELAVGGKKVNMAAAVAFKDGQVYLPLRSIVCDILGKQITYDMRGFAIVSDTIFPYTDDPVMSRNIEPIDYIYKYMQFENPDGKTMMEDLLKTTGGAHPRVILNNSEINYILDKVESGDVAWNAAYKKAIADGDAALNTVIPAECDDSTKNDHTSNYRARMYQLSLAYLLTGDEKYAKAGVNNLKNAAMWDDMGEDVIELNVGEWCIGTGYGVDSFYNYMQQSHEGREVFKSIKDTAKRIAFTHMINMYQGNNTGQRWATREYNFVGVCGSGALVMALAFATEEDMRTDIEYLLENMYKSMAIIMTFFAPDGGYHEGMDYMRYTMINYSKAMLALNRSCGSTYGLMSVLGAEGISDFINYMGTPTSAFNYHDADRGEYMNIIASVELSYLLNDPVGMANSKRHRDLNNYNLDVVNLMYYDKIITDKGLTPDISGEPLDHYFRRVEVGTFLSSLDTQSPTFVGFHGGTMNNNHDHMDLGQFVFESDKVRWACDNGSGNYNLAGYFDPGEMYKSYRKNVQGENCVLINPVSDPSYLGQNEAAYAPLRSMKSAPKGAYASYDLTSAYERDVNKYIRGYYFGDNRNTLTIRDEINLKDSSEIYWQMHTPAKIDIIDKNNVMLTYGEQKCKVEIVCSAPEYQILDMEPKLLPGSAGEKIDGQKSNAGVRKVAVYAEGVTGDYVVTVKIIPQNGNYSPTPVDGNTAIDNWIIPDGEIPKRPTLSALYADGVPVNGFYSEKAEYLIEVPFGTEKPPVISAVANVPEATVTVVNPQKFGEKAKVTVSCVGYRDLVYYIDYTVSSNREIFITDDLRDAKPQKGIMGTLLKPVLVATPPVPDEAHGPAHLTDDDFSTRCAIENECYFEIDLGEVTDIKGVAMSYYEGDKRAQIYDLLYSADGIHYQKVFSGQSTGETTEYESLNIEGKVRYIRVLGYGNTISTWNSITEIRALK